MRFLILIGITTAVTTLLPAEELTQADRETLREKLEDLQNSADAKVAARFSIAVSAFREAASSNEAAFDLYMKCVEKLEFEDQFKRGQDFREWKRKESDRLKSQAFHNALRHQLRWLILTLQVASNKNPDVSFENQARKLVNGVFSDIENLEGQDRVLQEAVNGTVFARAYDLKDIQSDDWPMSPIDLEAIYDKVLLPPFRNKDKTDDLRSGWMTRINQEIAAQQEWVTKKEGQDEESRRIGTKEALLSPELKKFAAQKYPELLWKMELDIFKAGDERGAALNLFELLEKYPDHPNRNQWTEEFLGLLETETQVIKLEEVENADQSQ